MLDNAPGWVKFVILVAVVCLCACAGMVTRHGMCLTGGGGC